MDKGSPPGQNPIPKPFCGIVHRKVSSLGKVSSLEITLPLLTKNVFQNPSVVIRGSTSGVYVEEVENVIKIYTEVIDKMGKVSRSQIKQRPWGTRGFSRWEVEQKHEKVFVWVALWSKLRNATTVVHHF